MLGGLAVSSQDDMSGTRPTREGRYGSGPRASMVGFGVSLALALGSDPNVVVSWRLPSNGGWCSFFVWGGGCWIVRLQYGRGIEWLRAARCSWRHWTFMGCGWLWCTQRLCVPCRRPWYMTPIVWQLLCVGMEWSC